MRIEIQIRSQEMHEQAERGLAAHWAYKEGKPKADINIPWVDDLMEILEHAESPEELLEHTRMAMYQDRIFAFTPKGELIQLPKGATPVDFAYAVHTDLGDRTVGAKVNGRVVPLRTMLENGDQVEILASEAQHPQPSWLRFVATGKARAGVRRFVRHKEREETVELGRKIYDEIVARLPAELDKDALKRALKKLKIENEDELMIAIARKRVSDEALMEALMPGSAGGDVAPRPLGQRKAISIKGLTPGSPITSRQCCHPIPGDRIVGLRREDEEIEVHVIGCDTLASGVDADWLDLAWGEGSDGGAARLAVILRDIPGALGTMSGILGAKHANIINLQLVHRDGSFQTFHLDIEVHDLAHLHAIIAALRDAEPVELGRADLDPRRLALLARWASPAASTASVTRSDALAVIGAICTGCSMPSSIGPITLSPPSSRSSFAEMLADCSPGMTRTLAGPDRRVNG